MRLFYFKKTTSSGLVGYSNAGYKFDSHKIRSQTDYIFCYNDTTISWQQTLVATTTNHFEIIALYEVGREYVWLWSVISHIQSIYQMPLVNSSPTIIYEGNTACVAQVREWYIKGDKTKHVSPKFLYAHELQENRQVDIKQIRSIDNLADLFTKSLSISTFEKLVYDIGLRRVRSEERRVGKECAR